MCNEFVLRAATGTLNASITNNTVGAPLSGNHGIRVDSGNSQSADETVCLSISGNTTAGSTNTNGTTFPGIGLRKQGTVATTHSFGITGMSATSSPGVENYVNSLNTSTSGTFGTGGTALISAQSGFTSCTLP